MRESGFSDSSVGRFFVVMNLQTILGKKMEQSQKFLEDGTRIPVTRLWVKGNVVVSVKTMDKDKYSSIQLGFGSKKKSNKASMGHIKGASLKQAPQFLKEVRIDADETLIPGLVVNVVEMLKEGDIIDVTGISKGKGYAGVVKRHGFAGGPRTHGQSDRERAPGSIGQTTTPGRVYKGKRMAGRMGHENVTIKNLLVVGVTEDEILVKGLVPGSLNTMIIVKKVGEKKKFTPLFGKKDEPAVAEALEGKEVVVEAAPEIEDTNVSAPEEIAEVLEKAEEGTIEVSTTDQVEAPAVEETSSEPSSETVVEEAAVETNEDQTEKTKEEEVKTDAS